MENTIGKLCEDALVEILCRLPDKPLIRFKCVSKSWYLLISQVCVPRVGRNAPITGIYFPTVEDITSCLSNGKEKHVLKYAALGQLESSVDQGFDSSVPCLNFLPFHPSGRDIIDTCNGLVLFFNPRNQHYYVCNPTTRQCAEIPRAVPFNLCSSAALVFDPTTCPFFKVINFVCLKDESLLKLVVYSSETDQWGEHMLSLDPIFCESRWNKQTVYLNRLVYKLLHCGYLLCIDIDPGNVHVIKLPCFDTGFIGCIGESNGSLCYAKTSGYYFRIWLLEDQFKAGKWILKYSFCFSDLLNQVAHNLQYRPFILCSLKPIAFHPKSDIIFLCGLYFLFIFHLGSKKLQEVYRCSGTGGKIAICSFPFYFLCHCLIPLDAFCKRKICPAN